MTEETAAPEGGDVTAIANVAPADAPQDMGINQAAKMLAELRWKRDNPNETAESADDATAEQESSVEDDAAPDEHQATSETQESDPADKEPPLELPRSWTKEQSERWASLDRATQEYLLEHDRKVSEGVRRSQNEAAEIRKAAEAERAQAEEARKQYQAQLPALMQALQDAQQSAFSDIRTVDDVTKLANEDPFRYLQWQAHQTKLQAVNAELTKANEEKSRTEQSKWAQHVQEENAKAAEFIPELADKTKGPALTQRVASELLPELGFTDSELADLANGKSKLSIYDHRVQRLLADAVKLRDIQKAPKAVAAKPLPPVQRPGTARTVNPQSEQIQNLTRQLNETGSLKAATELLAARRAASSRRAS